MKTLKTILYWLIWCTWGLPVTIVGAVMTLALIIIGKKPKTFCGGVYVETGKNWGGLSMGPFFFVNKDPYLHLLQHERGHGNQWILGTFMYFVVGIPSAARYWLREMETQADKYTFTMFLYIGLFIISLIVLLCGVIKSIVWLWIIGACLIAYSTALCAWLCFIEAPKYNRGVDPDYDDFWVEGWATKSGAKTYEKYTKTK